MQLVLGGPHGSLRETLAAANIAVDEPRRLLPAQPTAGESSSTEHPAQVPVHDLGVEPAPAQGVAPEPAAVPDWFSVTLGPKQTLIHLAKKHLGNGNRYREIMDANDWNEDDVRRLPAGQRVKIPRDATVRQQ